RGLCRCSARATSSLPVPDSPVMSTVACDCARRPIARNTSCIALAWPRISGAAGSSAAAPAGRRLSSIARRTSSTAWSTSNGLGRYSNAPPWNACTALLRSEYAVMMMTGVDGSRAWSCFMNSRPEVPGMRMSLSTTCGVSSPNRSSAWRAFSNVRCAMPSRASAFSNTQRIERSSSITQTGLVIANASRVRSLSPGRGLGRGSIRGPFHHRQQDREPRAPWNALELDEAAVLAHEALRERQAQAGAALAAAHQRIEDALGELRRDARAVVLDRHGDRMAVAVARDRHLARDARGDAD